MALKEEARAYLPEDQLELVDLYADKLILQPEEAAYLKACRKEANRIKQERRRRQRNIIIATVVAFLAMGLLTIYAFDARDKAEEAVKTIELNQKIKAAEELRIYGDNYLELEKKEAAREVYQAALDSLGIENRDLEIYQEMEDKIRDLE